MVHMRVSALVALLIVGVAVAGCGGDDEGSKQASAAAGGDGELTMGAALPGPINDRGYNQGFFQGLNQVKDELSAETTHVESLEDPAKALDAMNNLAINNELVLVAGGQFSDIAKTAASRNPDTTFVLVDGVPKDPPSNLHTYRVNYAENGYIAGVVAAGLTEEDDVAFIGGIDIPPVQISQAGFKQAVEAGDGVNLASTSIGTFNDPGAAREAASAQIAGGADIIFPVVDAAYTGALEAADAANGVDVIVSNRTGSVCEESPSIVGATTVDYAGLVLQIAEAYKAERLPDPKEPKVVGINDDLVGMTTCEHPDKQQAADLIEQTRRMVQQGEIDLPLK